MSIARLWLWNRLGRSIYHSVMAHLLYGSSIPECVRMYSIYCSGVSSGLSLYNSLPAVLWADIDRLIVIWKNTPLLIYKVSFFRFCPELFLIFTKKFLIFLKLCPFSRLKQIWKLPLRLLLPWSFSSLNKADLLIAFRRQVNALILCSAFLSSAYR